MLPLLGTTNPDIISKNVVLPDPLLPKIPIEVFLKISILILSKT